jgi:hypothetical protein
VPVDRLPVTVRDAVDVKTRTAVPPLLRQASESITTNLLRIAPIPRLAEEPYQPFHQKLIGAGVSTYGALLAREPSELFQSVGAEHAKALTEVLQEGEAVAPIATKAVFSAAASVARQSGAVTPLDFTDEEGLKKLGQAVTEALAKDKRVALPEPVVTAVVSDVVKGAAS